jgi:hypothetical protein
MASTVDFSTKRNQLRFKKVWSPVAGKNFIKI